MRLIGAAPKEIVGLFEFTLTELRMLKTSLDHTVLELNLTDPEHVKIKEYIECTFYGQISGFIKTLEEKYGDTSDIK